MRVVRKAYSKWESAKFVCASNVLSFVAGGLLHSAVRGKINEANLPAMYILLATVLTLIIILCTVGIRRWKNGQLDAFNKLFVVLSLVLYPVLCAVGWFADVLE